MSATSNFSTPIDSDIRKIIEILRAIQRLLTNFISEDFGRLAHPDIVQSYDVQSLVPIFNQRIETAINYVTAHRSEPTFRQTLSDIGFIGRELDFKNTVFSQILGIWGRIKNGATRIARRFADVVFDEIDSLLNSIAKLVPVLEGVIELKEHIQNGVSAAEALEGNA